MDDQKKGIGILEICKSVLMSFFGVQKESVRRRDFEKGKPVHFIITGFILTALFIAVLYGVVKLILHFGGL
ncbi:MAG TPA: DUF2970 domain-containing protein [Gammaproteobacteria bacterium]|nr:DUF2970 domain-containing protein [Gammaproteobacteria bacterium]